MGVVDTESQPLETRKPKVRRSPHPNAISLDRAPNRLLEQRLARLTIPSEESRPLSREGVPPLLADTFVVLDPVEVFVAVTEMLKPMEEDAFTDADDPPN